MKVIEVSRPEHEKEFLQLSHELYKNDPNWIAPLRQDIQKVFNPEKNNFFRHGECSRWILKDSNEQTIGRIAAFINRRTASSEKQPTGGCGFFECINMQEAANLLFDTAKNWLTERGMEAMDGPINFGERNAWWGLLVEGFLPPTYQMNYNLPYYQELFETYGFEIYFKQYSYHGDIQKPRPAKYQAIYKDLCSKGYEFKHIQKSRLKTHAEELRSVYNRAWGSHKGVKPMTEEQAWKLIQALKPVLIENLAWFGYYKGEPVSMFIMLPELNGWFKHLNGNLNWWGKLKFLWYKTFDRKNRKVFGIIFGVVPEHQKLGVESAMIQEADNDLKRNKRWDEIELVWIGDFNPKMMGVAKTLETEICKIHHTYRYLFDRSKPFERCPIIE